MKRLISAAGLTLGAFLLTGCAFLEAEADTRGWDRPRPTSPYDVTKVAFAADGARMSGSPPGLCYSWGGYIGPLQLNIPSAGK